MPNFDAIIIGTGQSGPALARRLVAAGRKVAVIERKLFGGTCVMYSDQNANRERLHGTCCTSRCRLRR
jgi:phytoene dehydrogenase-like protein